MAPPQHAGNWTPDVTVVTDGFTPSKDIRIDKLRCDKFDKRGYKCAILRKVETQASLVLNPAELARIKILRRVYLRFFESRVFIED